ncbi:MAG: ATP-binding protein [Helicobacteraceae bacterium 4484_230]|nr:MAG: ATP-binding protein [Helicobacteraceae bacterium 4484_230]
MHEKRAKKTRFVAITSGKGGVGKSTISSNLSWLLAKSGLKVAVFDADLGLANLDVMFNVRVRKNLLHVLKGEASVKDILIPIRKNLLLIPGESGEEILKFSNSDLFENFVKEANILDDMDVMIIDTGAGIGESMQLFLQAADDVVVVTVPDPAAITDAYATIKVTARKRNDIYMIMNQVRSEKEANGIFGKIKKVAQANISEKLELNLMGSLALSDKVSESVKRRAIFVKEHPSSNATRELEKIANRIARKIDGNTRVNAYESGLTGLFKRLFDHF